MQLLTLACSSVTVRNPKRRREMGVRSRKWFVALGIAALALAMYAIHRVRKDQPGREDTITANCSRWVQKVQRIYDKLKEGVGNK